MPQSWARGSILASCSWVEGPVARGTQRFLRLSSRLPRKWDFQSRKTLRKFFKNFGLKCFGGCIWRLTSATKNACFAQWRQFLKSFSVFPRTFCDCSSSLSTVSFPNASYNPFWTPLLLPFNSESSSNRYGFSFSNSVLLDFVFFPLEYSHFCLFWVGFLFRLLLFVRA